MNLKTFALIIVFILFVLQIYCDEPLYIYHREITVSEQGWVKLNIPIKVLSRLTSSIDEILVTDESGKAIPIFKYEQPLEKPSIRRTVALSNVEHSHGAYIIDADLGPGNFRHRLLYIDLPGKGLAEGVVLEGSDDKNTWHILQKGSMFRLNYEGLTEKTYLEYTPTTFRYLRIYWPEGAGFPNWQSVTVADWSEKEENFVVEDIDFEKAVDQSYEKAYYLSLPPFPLEKASLTLFPPTSYPLSCLLKLFSNGEWQYSTETLFLPELPSTLVLPPQSFSGKSLLVLNSGGYEIKDIEMMQIKYVPITIIFKAEKAGNFNLYYRAIGGAPPPKLVSNLEMRKEKFVQAKLGSEIETNLEKIPLPDILMGGEIPKVDFALRSEIKILENSQANFVSLELPLEVYGYLNPGLSDIRLECKGRQVPYILYSPPENGIVLEKRGVTPLTIKNKNSSLIDIELPSEKIPLSFIELTTPSQPFSRKLSLEYKRKGSIENGIKEEWCQMASGMWQCAGDYGIPSRISFKCYPIESREMRIVFDDEDNAPLSSVNLILWCNKNILVFPEVKEEKIFFCGGSPSLSKPVYDFEKLSNVVLTHKSSRATLQNVKAEPQGKKITVFQKDIVLSKWLLLFSILAACFIIIFILIKSIGEVR